MINVDDIFINKETNIMLRVLSYAGEGDKQSCYCILEKDGESWHGDYSGTHINKYYTKLESFSGYIKHTSGEQK